MKACSQKLQSWRDLHACWQSVERDVEREVNFLIDLVNFFFNALMFISWYNYIMTLWHSPFLWKVERSLFFHAQWLVWFFIEYTKSYCQQDLISLWSSHAIQRHSYYFFKTKYRYYPYKSNIKWKVILIMMLWVMWQMGENQNHMNLYET